MSFDQRTLQKIFLCAIAVAVGWYIFRFDTLDLLLVLYFGMALLFGWSGVFVFNSGVVLFLLTAFFSHTRPDIDITRLLILRWIFLAVGIALIMQGLVVRYAAWQRTFKLFCALRDAWRSRKLERGIEVGAALLYNTATNLVFLLRREVRGYWGRNKDLFPFTRTKEIALLAFIFFVLIFATRNEMVIAAFLLFGVIVAAFHLDSRVAAVGALLCLAFMEIFILLRDDLRVEVFAGYLYYFLVIVVIQALLELRVRPNGEIEMSS